jgi:hypothetical protein
LNLENNLVNKIRLDNRYGKEPFTYISLNNPRQLGGKRGSLNPFSPESAKTWKVAANPLAWSVRSVNIKAKVEVSAQEPCI